MIKLSSKCMHSCVALNETEQHAQYFLSLLSQQCDMHAGRLARCLYAGNMHTCTVPLYFYN